MRGLSSVMAIVFFGCTSRPKPPADLDGRAVEHAPRTPDASLLDPSQSVSSSSESLAQSTSAPPPSGPAPEVIERPPTAAEKCAAQGGTIQPICRSGHLACVVRYRDGGKPCSDKSDCIGECRYEGRFPAPPNPTGRCQLTSDPCGCRDVIHDGRVDPLCAD